MAEFDGFDLGNMEGGMDPPDLEAHRSRVDDLGYQKRSQKPGSGLGTLSPVGQIMRRNPDLLVHPVLGSWVVVTNYWTSGNSVAG